jgi:hypothetical protein
MTAADISCEVYVDGQRLADTAAEFLASIPTALAGLQMSWGRGTVVDQPDASVCSFTVADIGGDADFLSLLHVGHVVDVYAAGAIASSGPVDVAIDGSFEIATAANRVAAAGGTAVVDLANPAVGNRAILATPAAAAAMTVDVPPGPFSTAHTAWNTIPKIAAGQQWRITLQVALGAGCTATIAPAIFDDPAHRAPVATGPATAIPASPTATYRTITLDWTVLAASPAGWLGARLAITNTQRWVDAVGTWAAQTLTWRQIGSTWLDDLHVLAPAQAQRRVMVFSGRITDMTASNDTRLEVKVTAADRFADLGNDYIGDEPWLVQTIANRIKRIIALAATPFTVDVASWPGGRSVTWVDIDSQSVAGLLSDLATSADAVLWSVFAANRGFYLWVEDPSLRQAMAVLAIDTDTGLVVIVGNPRPANGVILTACDLARNVDWTQDVSDVLSIVDLTWLEQTTDTDGQPAPTERHIVLTDADAVEQFGQRRGGYSTQLVNAADGTTVAQRIMNRSRALGWRAAGVQWDTDLPREFADTDRATALTILAGYERIGLPVTINELPAWTPGGDTIGMFLEGGSYRYEGGRWIFDLTLSPAGLTGASIKWNQVNPAYRWRDFSPSIEWWNLAGVGAAA